jgi:hypothetical protein
MSLFLQSEASRRPNAARGRERFDRRLPAGWARIDQRSLIGGRNDLHLGKSSMDGRYRGYPQPADPA